MAHLTDYHFKNLCKLLGENNSKSVANIANVPADIANTVIQFMKMNQSQNMECDKLLLDINKTQVTPGDEDHWSEDEVEIPAGVTDTMLATELHH